MKKEHSIQLIILLMICSISAFSQNTQSKKQEFVYKTVNGHAIKANLFLPDFKGKCPVFIYFHGGGFIFGNKDEGLDNNLKEKLLGNNYAVVSANYRLAPETKLEAILEDVEDLVKWIRIQGGQTYNIDVNQIAVAGGSTGGYLAISSGFEEELKPNAIVAISAPTGFNATNIQMGDLSILNLPGPYDIVKDNVVSHGDYSTRKDLYRFLGRNRLALFEIFGFDPAKEPEKLERFTLTNKVQSFYPPILLVHSRNDYLVDLGQVKAFDDFLKKKKLESKLIVVENGHSNELIKQHPESLDEIILFLDKYLKKQN